MEQWKTTNEPHGPHTTSIIEYKHHGIIGNGTGPSPIRIWWIWLNLEHWIFYEMLGNILLQCISYSPWWSCFGQHMKCLQEVRHGNSALRNKKPTLIRPAWRGLWWFNDAVPSVSKAFLFFCMAPSWTMKLTILYIQPVYLKVRTVLYLYVATVDLKDANKKVHQI